VTREQYLEVAELGCHSKEHIAKIVPVVCKREEAPRRPGITVHPIYFRSKHRGKALTAPKEPQMPRYSFAMPSVFSTLSAINALNSFLSSKGATCPRPS
jgi:hypothetical protein